ncbi:hypothetical protein NW768_010235 [Fusarium equiseti]|uniref:Protein-tyrosine-phosphatase n=1 Tax=Fusarium equiseti TaxID=61235 RepID=A0ABQ8R1A5_FUSEQ|nr:hypothetical protein NW768_010235 [Fusarium equiseti]
MEPVGLAVGVVGLAGLFSTCLDALQRLDSYKTASRDSRQLDAQLSATIHLFERWGEGVGINQGKLSKDHHRDLDDPRTFAVIQRLLGSINEFLQTSNNVPKKNLDFTIPNQGPEKISRWEKTAWALRGRLKQTNQVQTLASLVADLYNIIPPTDTPSDEQNKPSIDGSYADEMRELLGKIEEQLKAEEIRDLLTWLGSPSTNSIYDDSRDKRLDKTCEWILQRKQFLEWNVPSRSSKVLWIRGPAGFGKTILCSRLVEEVENTSTSPVASFFLSSKSEGRDDPFVVIRSWLTTLVMRSKAAHDIVRASRTSQHEQKATQAHVLSLFRSLLMEIPGCSLILDGLDECESVTGTDVESIPRFLDGLSKAISDTNTRLLITSRGNRDIQQGLSLFPCCIDYEITADDVATDLLAYSSQIVSTRLSNKDELTRRFIANKMKDRCEGQFQWIKLQERSLRKGRNRKQLEREIDSTPSGLDSLYDREWRRINSMGVTDRERALALLRWIVFAVRPLNVFEISEAVLVTDDCEELPVDEMPDEFDDDYVESMILNLCGSLLETRHPPKNEVQTIGPTHYDCTRDKIQFGIGQNCVGFQEVHLTHFSVKEYLLSTNLFPLPSPISNENLRVLNERLGNTVLAKSCLRYINFPGAWENWQADHPATRLLSYAAESWPIHYKRVQAPDAELRSAINNLFEGQTRNFEAWTDWHGMKLFDLPERRARKVHPLHIAISLGLEEVVADLIRKSKQVINIRSDSNAAALHFLCFAQSKSLAEILIDNGAELDPVVGSRVTPLSLALTWGNTEIAEVLLVRGASVTLADDSGQTPLHIVAEQGNVDLARQIVDRGADLSAKAKDGYTPLLYAARDGHCSMVKLLLERGANYLDSIDGHTAVGLAAWYNNTSVVRVLLDRGADMEATGNRPSLLSITASRGHIELAELILDRGAFVDGLCYGTTGHTPLYLAFSGGNYAIAETLMRRGADITVVSKSPKIPLYQAAIDGRHDIVELLLKDDGGGGKDAYAALKIAIINNHLEAVETLYKAIRFDDSIATTPLHIAARNGRLQAIKVLLNAGADPMAKDSTGRIALSYAAEYGHASTVDFLSREDYSYLTCVDNCQRTPMHFPCGWGHLEVVSLILSRLPKTNSMIDARDCWGSTPLSVAARQGHTEIVKLLLATKLVDKNSSDDLGRTIEWWATQRGHSEILTLITGTEHQQTQEKREDKAEGRFFCDICYVKYSLPTMMHDTEWSELFTNNPSYEPTSYKALDNLASNDELAFLHHKFWHEIREWTRNDTTEMTRIVHPDLTGPGSIFIGGMNHALNETILEENNIQAVISIHPKDSLAWDKNDTTSGLQRFFTNSSVVKYPLIIPLEDNANSDLISCFDETNAFIKKHTKEGRNILIHCKSGRSRSVAVLIAYLQQKFYSEKSIASLEKKLAKEQMRMHREDVTEAIRKQRLPVVIIMERFAELLELYDLRLIGALLKDSVSRESEPVQSVTPIIKSDKKSELVPSKVVQTKGGAAVLKICVAAVFFKNNQKPTEAVVHQFFEINEAYFYELEGLEYKGRSYVGSQHACPGLVQFCYSYARDEYCLRLPKDIEEHVKKVKPE